MDGKSVMGDGAEVERYFEDGVFSAHELHVLEHERQREAGARLRAVRTQTVMTEAEIEAALQEIVPMPPMWQCLCRIPTKNAMRMEPSARRAGIRRLLRVFERMYRSELKREDVDLDGGPAALPDGSASYAGRSAVWDPLPEICVYLEISKAKLNALAVERTGLRASEIGDCIRTEKLRARLKAKFAPLMGPWFEMLDVETKNGVAGDLENAAWRFLKWMRGGARGETRKKLAFELGLTSREKLDRAVLIGERETLEALEVGIAMEILKEILEKPTAVPAETGSHGAGCDEVANEVESRGSGVGSPGIGDGERAMAG